MKTKTFAPADNFQPVAFVSSTKDPSVSYIVWLKETEKRKDWGCTCGAFKYHSDDGPCKHMKLVFAQSRKLRKKEIEIKDIDTRVIFTSQAKNLVTAEEQQQKKQQKVLFKINK